MKILLLSISSKQPPWLEEVLEGYRKKLSFWISFESKTLTSPSADRDNAQSKITQESDIILKALVPTDFLLLCDVKGKKMSSEAFSQLLEKTFMSGKKRLVVLIGGSYGVSKEIKTRADMTISLSDLTFNHHIAISVAAEQIYRGMTILKGVKYHNA